MALGLGKFLGFSRKVVVWTHAICCFFRRKGQTETVYRAGDFHSPVCPMPRMVCIFSGPASTHRIFILFQSSTAMLFDLRDVVGLWLNAEQCRLDRDAQLGLCWPNRKLAREILVPLQLSSP